MHPLRDRELSGDAVETIAFSRTAEIVDAYVRHLTALPPHVIEKILPSGCYIWSTMISDKRNFRTDPEAPRIYQIRLEGHLDTKWADWFDGLTITLEENGDTTLTGPVIDQAALHGLLRKVRDLGIPLLSVNQVISDEEDMPDVKQ